MASNQSQSISWNKKTKDGPFAPNESFPVEILPSIKNQIKRWSSAFSTVHPLRDTYTHTILICDFLSDGHLVLRCKKWFMRSTAVECECVCVLLSAGGGGVKFIQPSFTAVGQPSNMTAGDQHQTGKVTGPHAAVLRLQNLKSLTDDQARCDCKIDYLSPKLFWGLAHN